MAEDLKNTAADFNIQEELKKLPVTPGVYLMRDFKDDVIYVGKAVNLKRRVKSYFAGSTKKTAKIKTMASKVKRFEYIMTDSELEALILECNLIKEYRPKYNTRLMDNKAYPYIEVTANEDYPRIFLARKMQKDGNRYFGPFTSAAAVRDTISLLQKMYHIRNCKKSITEKTPEENASEPVYDADKNQVQKQDDHTRACLYYHIGQCKAPCLGLVSKEDYRTNVDGAIKFLEGDYKDTIKELEAKMKKASDELDFESAKEYRDLIAGIHHVAGHQKITTNKFDDRDIIAYAADEREAVVQVFFVRDGKLIGRDHFYVETMPGDTGREILTNFIKQYYTGTPFVPAQILVQEPVDEPELLSDMLSGGRGYTVRVICPKKGEKEKLMELAARNAAALLEQNKEKYRREKERTTGAVAQIGELLGLENLHRFESYDISNTLGYESVASMVVYNDGRPKKNAYRRFKIKTVKGPDDYSSMKETINRRFAHGFKERMELDKRKESYEYGSFSVFPDLILIDGGKGQVNAALEALSEQGVNIPVCGMVKDDSHRTRGLYFQNAEVSIDHESEAFRLIARIQDETHRFAISYHRSLRGKEQVHSILDDIPGVGPTRRKALMKNFGSIEKVKSADMAELENTPSIDKKTAESIYRFFH